MCTSLVAANNPIAHKTATMTVSATFEFHNMKLESNALIDTGSDDCIMPLSTFGPNNVTLLSPCNQTLYGISKKPIRPVGEFSAMVSFGTAYFKNVRLLVVDVAIPILIGKSLLFHSSMNGFQINKATICFNRKFGKQIMEQKVPFVGHTTTLKVGSSDELPNSFPSLEAKLDWLKTHRSLTLPSSHSKKDELAAVADLLLEFNDCFGYEGSELGTFPDMVRIPTKPGMAKSVRQHPIAKQFQPVVDGEIEKMLANGVIDICPDPKGFNSPIIVVGKKDGKPRVCANFKNTVNKCLADNSDSWQMPDTDSIFSEIGKGNKYFGSLDFKSAYWQCTIHPDDRHKTSFQWGNRCYQFVRLPFGLTCAGDMCCRAISKALDSITNKENFKSYIDDLFLHAKTFAAFLVTLRMILQACRANGLKLNSEKCKLLQEESEFLGRIVCEDGYKANPDYVAAILKMPPPTTKKELQAAIGRFVWLRAYLEVQVGEQVGTNCFSNLMSALNKLNRKDKNFTWTDEAQAAFELAKSRLSSPGVIYFADFSKPFILVTDASNIAVGCAILQKCDNKQRIVAVGSKTLNKTQQNWSTTEREAYAIIWAVEKFAYFLRGPNAFLLLTDHRSLIFMDRNIFANQKIARWQDRLSEFKFVLQYIEGAQNGVADMLSRPFGIPKTVVSSDEAIEAMGKFYTVDNTNLRVYVPSWISTKLSRELLLIDEKQVTNSSTFLSTAVVSDPAPSPIITEFLGIAEAQMNNPTLSKIIGYLQSDVDCTKWQFDEKDHREKIYTRFRERFRLDPYTNLLLIVWTNDECVVVPETLRPYYLKTVHDDSGHFGIERVSDFLKHLWWPGKANDVHNYVQSCIICTRRKGNYGKHTKPSMGHLLRGSKPFEVIYTDFVHMPQSPKGKRYVLTIIDSFSRFLYCYPTTRDRAIDAATGLLHFMLEYEIPKVISSDRGTHFINSVIEDLCQNMGIKQNIHTAWRPQSSGNIERAHRTLKNGLWATVADRKCSWVEALPYVRRAMNLSKNAATGCSPHFAVYGKDPVLVGVLAPGNEVRSTQPASYGMSVQQMLQKTHKIIAVANEEADYALEKRDNPSNPAEEILPGDEAYLFRPESAFAKTNHLAWVGPYTVIKTNSQVVQILQNGLNEWVHRFHLVKKIPRRPDLEIDVPPNLIADSPLSESGREEHNPENNCVEETDVGSPANKTPKRPVRDRRPPARFSPRMDGKTHATRLACKF